MDAVSLNHAADRWFLFISSVAVQATIAASVALVIVGFAKRLPTNFRYVLLVLAMVKFFMPPFVGWPGGVFGQFTFPAVSNSATEFGQTPHVDDPSQELAIVASQENSVSAIEFSDDNQSTAAVSMEPPQTIKAPGAVVAVGDEHYEWTPSTVHAMSPLREALSINTWLMACWVTGVAVLLLRTAAGAVCLRSIEWRCQPAVGVGKRTFEDVARLMKVRRARLLLCAEPLTPMACGFFHPTVVVPQSFVEQFSSDEQRAIFAHELAHHRRLDPLVLWLQGAFVAIWWFHPLAWLLNRTILRFREQCCDDLVITENLSTQHTYAAAVVKAVEWCSLRMQLLKYAAPQMHPLRDRIASLMDPATRRASKLSLCHWCVVVVLGLAVLPGFGVSAPALTAPSPITTEARPDAQSTESAVTKGATRSMVGGRVLDTQGQPIQGNVWLRTDGDSEGGFRRCETNADGRYQFEDVAPGWVNVAALGEGHSHTGVSFTLQSGRSEENLNLIATAPQTLNLNVRNEQGEPIAGVCATSIGWLTSQHAGSSLYPELMEALGMEVPESDANGHLSIPRLPSDVKLTVYLRHSDYVVQRLEGLTVNEPVIVALDPGEPAVVTAIDAETLEPVTDATVSVSSSDRGVSISGPVGDDGTFLTRLPKTGSRVHVSVRHPSLIAEAAKRKYRDGTVYYTAKLYRTGRIQGRVINETTGDPVSGLRISVMRQNAGVGHAVSDDEGEFEMQIPAGVFCRVSVQNGGGFYTGTYRKTQVDAARTSYPPLTLSPDLDVKVKPGETVVVEDLKVKSFPPIHGVVLLPDGKPAAGALVYHNSWPSASLRTGADGRFEIVPRDASLIHLQAYHLYQPLMSGVGVAVQDLFAGTEQQIRLQSPTEVRGLVLDENQEPAVGVEVTLLTSISIGPEGQVGTMSSHSRAASCVTDSKGEFQVAGLSRHLRYSAVVGEPFERGPEPTAARSRWVQPTAEVTQLGPIHLTTPPPATAEESTASAAPPLDCRHWLNSAAMTPDMTKGQVVVLQFCDAVVSESIDQLPAVQDLHDLYRDKGCVVIAVFHSSTTIADAEAIMKTHRLSLPIAIDNVEGETFHRYGVRYVPNTVLIGRDCRIVSGRVPNNELLMHLRQAFFESPAE